MANLSGADIEALNQLRRTLENEGASLRKLTVLASQGVTTLERVWQGQDSAQFKQAWATTHRPKMNKAVAEILAAADTIERNRQAQVETSAADGVAPSGNGASGNSASGGPGENSGGKKLSDELRVTGWKASSDPLEVYGFHPNDVSQGSFGNCFLLTSLIVMADKDQDLIDDMIGEQNPDGSYPVTFWEEKDGEMVPITIDVTAEFAELEGKNSKGDWVSGNTAGSGDGELWPRLLEKAYAQHVGDGDIEKGLSIMNEGGRAGVTLETLTGVKGDSTTNMGEFSIEELEEMSDGGTAITLSSLNKNKPGFFHNPFKDHDGFYNAGADDAGVPNQLHTGHAYWVESVDAENDMITIRNPWGYQTDAEDTQNKYVITLTYDEFKENFDRIDTNQIQGDEG